MDSIPLEMDDIFGDYDGESDGENGFNPARLPDLEDELEPMRDIRHDDEQAEGEEEITDNAELLAKLKSMKGASKNTTKRIMPKLDATRLTGERGMAILPKAFEHVHLRGRNHEAEDLKIIMHTLQHWGHRLFPKMTFDEVLERVERLGAKKEVQTCLKKIRLDMPVLASDMIHDEEDTVRRVGDENAKISGDESHQETDRINDSHNEISDEELEDLLRDQRQPVANQPITTPSQRSAPVNSNSGLSEEVRKRIEENKRKAMERRATKMTASTSKSDITVNINDSLLDSSNEMDSVNQTERLQMDVNEDDMNSNERSFFQDDGINGNASMEKSSSSGKIQNLNEGSGPFQISSPGVVATQKESMEFEPEVVANPQESMLCEPEELVNHNTLEDERENDTRLKNQELEEIIQNSIPLDKCRKLTETSSPLKLGEERNKIQCSSSEITDNCEGEREGP